MARKAYKQRYLTNRYVDDLAQSVERRLAKGTDLQGALKRTLRERAPVLLRRPSRTRRVTSFVPGRITRAGLVALAGLGINYAVRRLRGTGSESRQVERGYRPVHGTAGAEMPDPEKEPAAESAMGRTGPSSEPRPRPESGETR